MPPDLIQHGLRKMLYNQGVKCYPSGGNYAVLD